jgi:septal ring factor EnvC (AmiA/AmiB activator)
MRGNINLTNGLAPKLALLCTVAAAAFAQGEVEDTRGEIREWIELRKEINKERVEWTAESAILNDRIRLLRAERERLETAIEEARENVGEVAAKRAEVNAQREQLRATMEQLREPLAALEARARALYPQLPGPLQAETVRLLQRIPEDAAETRLSVAERLQAVVGLLNFADKFNTGIQREVEIRELSGRQVEVEVLYFGLAGAFYADSAGTVAGIGVATADGWEWQAMDEQRDEISRLIGVYNGTREADFHSVPVRLR